MLKRLTVRNFAVIDELSLEFGPGLQALTGETGAGKSILVEALGFLLGERGSTDWIRAGADKLEVAGIFEAKLEPPAGLPPAPWVLSRELDATGRSRARLNGKPATGAQLAALGEALADFHGQHEHQTLLKPARQLDLLDGFAGLEPLGEKLAAAWRTHQEAARRLQALKLSEDERLRRIDLCRWRLEEIDKVGPKPGEEEELEAALPKLKNAERLLEAGQKLYASLYKDEGSAAETLTGAVRAAGDLAALDPQAAEIERLVREAKLLVEEAAGRVADYKNGVDLDPAKLDETLGRLDKLAKLRKKYGPTTEEVLARRERAAEELRSLENHDAEAEAAEKELAAARKKLEALSDEAHDKRLAAGKKLAAAVGKELQDLGMPGARFSISVELEEGALGPAGADKVEFLISPNPGEELKPLRAIASGGETSRTMLALKTVLAKADRVPILVFDEVDAGVGGVVARTIGKKLAALAKRRQVLCVTHLPQVACYADGHFHVSKAVAAGRTKAKVAKLEAGARLEEMARLLGGHDSSAAAKKHAEELLSEARKELAA